MNNVTLLRLLELKNRLALLKRKAESAVSNVRCIVKHGNSVVFFQDSIQEIEHFLRSYPVAAAELRHLINIIKKLNCNLEITLTRRSDLCDVLSNYENNESIFYNGAVLSSQALCEACAKEKNTVDTNTGIITVDSISEFDRESITKLYDVYEYSILEMKYLRGDDPSQFWLGFYSNSKLLSHLAEIKRKLQLGELHRVSATPVVGQFIIGHVGSLFRGCIISYVPGQLVAVDIDTSALKLLNSHDIWEIGDCLSCLPPQAIFCKLWNIEGVAGWTTYLSTLFKNCLKKCNLVVTVKDIMPGVVPTFMIDLDAHDGIALDVNMSEWIISYVKPAIEKMKIFGFDGDSEKAIFQGLDPYAIYGKDSFEFDISTPVKKVTGLPDVGEQLTVVITKVVNMGLFYAVPSKIMYEGRFQNSHKVLRKMNTKINSAVQGGHLKISKQLYEGTLVVARFSKDKNWYRARVLATPSESRYVEVFFVDYGNIDRVHKLFVREMRKDFCELPFQAMRLCIDGINLNILKEKNAQEIAQTLLTNLKDKFEVVINVTRVVNKDVQIQVMYEGRDIGEEMINLYYAS